MTCSHLNTQIACLLMTQAAEITVRFMNMKKQQGSYDCGIYAIAYATDLVYGQDPASSVTVIATAGGNITSVAP